MRATYSVLKPGAPNCYYVITNARNLSDEDRDRLAHREGSEHIESPVPYEVLMGEAGFVNIEVTDVTSQYVETLMGLKREWEADADAFIKLVGEEELARKLHNRTLDISNTEDGLIRRYRIYATKKTELAS